jgi:hypothetical protein
MHPTSKSLRPDDAASMFIADTGVSGNHWFARPSRWERPLRHGFQRRPPAGFGFQ